MNTLPKYFCVMPWVHQHVRTDGKITACCVSSYTYGEVKDGLQAVWKNQKTTDFREKLLRGDKLKQCSACHHREQQGVNSLRKEYNTRYQHLLPAIQANQTPISFDIRFSNKCNFRCRTCWHGASSRWYEEAKILKRTAGENAVITSVNKNFFEEFKIIAPHVKEVYFAGGEPLVMDEHYQVLDILAAANNDEVLLRYTTNLSILQFRAYNLTEIWSRFKHIEIGVSIDATGPLGEYIRKEMNWDKVVQNRNQVRYLQEKNPHIHIFIHPTISLLNILKWPSIYQELVTSGFISAEAVQFNVLTRPMYYNIQALPIALKQQVNQLYDSFLKTTSIPSPIKKEIRSFISYMNAEDNSTHFKAFINETKKIDQLRNENILEVLPEFSAYFEA